MSPSSTSSSEPVLLRPFVLRLVAFMLPLAVGWVLVEANFWRYGEAWPVAWAARRQAPDLIYERAVFSQQTPLFKLRVMQDRAPDAIVLGSSRVMQFRREAFAADGVRFYNAGGMVNSVDDLAYFATALRGGLLPRPRLVLLGIDPWWLKRGQPPIKRFAPEFLADEAWELTAHVSAMRTVLAGGRLPEAVWLMQAPSRSAFGGYRSLGLYPMLTGGGWRQDGSWYYGEWIERLCADPGYRSPQRVDFEEQQQRSAGFFLPSPGLDWSAVGRVEGALAEIRSMGVEVVVILPPFSQGLRRAFDSPGQPWWSELQETFIPRLRDGAFYVYDANTPEALGFSEDYMLDAIHPTEVLATAIVLDLAKGAPEGSWLRRMDSGRLRALLQRPEVRPPSLRLP